MNVIDRLKKVFIKYPQVLLAYLYGSYARGFPSPLSGVDIAILTSDRGVVLDLVADVARELSVPESQVSITDLELMDPLIRLKILREGVELVNRGVDTRSLLPRDQSYVEVYELEERSSSLSWLRGDPIDIVLIRDVVARIHEDVRDLEELLSFGFERVIGDKHLRKSFERTMQTLIESMVDLLRHIVAGLNLGVAMYYRDYVDFAVKGGVISSDVAEQLRRFIPIRHALVRRYRSLDYEKLWGEAPKLVQLANQLVSEVREFLKRRLGLKV